MIGLNWTEEQTALITAAIEAETENSRLAHRLIPEYSLAPSERAVSRDRYIYSRGSGKDEYIDETFQDLGVDAQEDLTLTKLQTEDPDLSRALVLVRRAAQRLARQHDEAVFKESIRDQICRHSGDVGFHEIIAVEGVGARKGGPRAYGDGLNLATAMAIAELDSKGYRSGFVMIAGQIAYAELYRRATGAADLPLQAVQGLLEDGPIHRCAVLPPNEALVLSISGEEVDRAVAVPPTLEFLRIGEGEKREFRLYERFLPRFKQTYAAVLLRLGDPVDGVEAEQE